MNVSNWERVLCLPPGEALGLIGSIMTRVERSDLVAAIGEDARNNAVAKALEVIC